MGNSLSVQFGEGEEMYSGWLLGHKGAFFMLQLYQRYFRNQRKIRESAWQRFLLEFYIIPFKFDSRNFKTCYQNKSRLVKRISKRRVQE